MSRILTGRLKGRKIQSIEQEGLRPTQGVLRQALINTLASYLSSEWSSLQVLDLFAGLGLVGLELLSNGVESVSFLEANPRSVRLLRENLKVLNLDLRAHVLNGFLPSALSKLPGQKYNFVFLDPPYLKNLSDAKLVFETFELLLRKDFLKQGALIVCEYNHNDTLNQLPERFSGKLKLLKTKKFGDSLLFFFEAL